MTTHDPSRKRRPSTGRVMRTPEIEPLTVAPADRMPNIVALIARAAERNADREAMRWKLTEAAARRTGCRERAWTSRTYREMWDWVTKLSLGLKDLGIVDGDAVCIIARTRPAVDDRRSGLAGARGRDLPDLSRSRRPGQAAFVINNVRAKADLRRERAAGGQDRVDPRRMPDPRARHHARRRAASSRMGRSPSRT